MESNSLLLKVSEVAALLRVSQNLVYELVAQGQLPVIRLGRVIRVPRTALERWIEQQAQINPTNANAQQSALYSAHRGEQRKRGINDGRLYSTSR